MPNLYNKIKSKIQYLPPKDASLCYEYLRNRDFESILDITESAIKMKERDNAKEVHQEKWKNIDVGELQKLMAYTQEYISLLDISDLINDYG